MAKTTRGRPTVMTDEVVRKIEHAFSVGCSDIEACCYADVSRTALHEYTNRTDDYANRKEMLKSNPLVQAKFIISQALDEGDLNTANRVIDRKEGQKIVQENINVELTHEQWLDGLK